jgi:hypothetical protein
MKKLIITTLSLVAGTVLLHAQGTVKFYNTATTFYVSTNTTLSTYSGGTQGVSNAGPTFGSIANPASTGKGYYYELLTAAYSGTLNSTDIGNAAVRALWTDTGAVATNSPGAGGLAGPGGNNGAPIANWASAPSSGSAYTDGTEMQFMIVGWSANLGSSWGVVQGELASRTWNATGYFGISAAGFGYSGGGGSTPLPVTSLFGVTSGMPGGLAAGFQLDQVQAVPEPATMALVGLGGLALLAFRRRQ